MVLGGSYFEGLLLCLVVPSWYRKKPQYGDVIVEVVTESANDAPTVMKYFAYVKREMQDFENDHMQYI